MPFPVQTKTARDARARRAAKRCGLVAVKNRKRRDSADNFGEFMLVDDHLNCVVAGGRFDLSAEEVLRYCGAK